jgi:hypothetical protein
MVLSGCGRETGSGGGRCDWQPAATSIDTPTAIRIFCGCIRLISLNWPGICRLAD